VARASGVACRPAKSQDDALQMVAPRTSTAGGHVLPSLPDGLPSTDRLKVAVSALSMLSQ
jgi:hypothetical protein